MTSPFTTGGIRGNKKGIGQFHPRSFNMGISRKVWENAGGFIITRLGEDIEYSIRIHSLGYKIGLICDAIVYHKRRTDFVKFFKQLHFFGRARINVYKFFPGQLKAVHFFPAVFTLGLLFTLIANLFGWLIAILCNISSAYYFVDIFSLMVAKQIGKNCIFEHNSCLYPTYCLWVRIYAGLLEAGSFKKIIIT
jgi:GT2 family glycosyltransferase